MTLDGGIIDVKDEEFPDEINKVPIPLTACCAELCGLGLSVGWQ